MNLPPEFTKVEHGPVKVSLIFFQFIQSHETNQKATETEYTTNNENRSYWKLYWTYNTGHIYYDLTSYNVKNTWMSDHYVDIMWIDFHSDVSWVLVENNECNIHTCDHHKLGFEFIYKIKRHCVGRETHRRNSIITVILVVI